MPLYATNLRAFVVTLAAGNPAPVLPANSRVNVTSELRALTGPQQTAIQVQIAAGDLDLTWDGMPEYSTGAMATMGLAPAAHAAEHLDGGSDPIDDATGSDAGLMSAADKAKLDAMAGSATEPTAGEKAALAGTSGVPGVANKYVTNADARNTNARTPSVHAASHKGGGSDAIDIATGALAGLESAADKTKLDSITVANVPSAGEKAALAGTDGVPGAGNKYVTDSDARNTNARTPVAHAASHASGGSDAITDVGPITGTVSDGAQATVLTALTSRRATSNVGNGAAGIGVKHLLQAEDSGGAVQDAGYLAGVLAVASAGTEKGYSELAGADGSGVLVPSFRAWGSGRVQIGAFADATTEPTATCDIKTKAGLGAAHIPHVVDKDEAVAALNQLFAYRRQGSRFFSGYLDGADELTLKGPDGSAWYFVQGGITRITLHSTGTYLLDKVGFFGAAPVAQQAVGATLTNGITAGGTANQIDNFTDLVVYANDAATIRNDLYQLGQKVLALETAGKAFGQIGT